MAWQNGNAGMRLCCFPAMISEGYGKSATGRSRPEARQGSGTDKVHVAFCSRLLQICGRNFSPCGCVIGGKELVSFCYPLVELYERFHDALGLFDAFSGQD